ncbi:MAG: IS630 family transposase [Deltaproteobacteria bacterium]|nr:IS630 family transposase [Deltaproteobacteria bacterium]
MTRVAERPVCSKDDLETLEVWSRSQILDYRLVQRARLVLLSSSGLQDAEIAKELDLDKNTVATWRKRYISSGIDGLYDFPRPGKPPIYEPDSTRKAVLEIISKPPPLGQNAWDGKSVAKELGISADKAWQILRQEGISLKRQRSWCVRTDPQFAARVTDIIGLYLEPPQNALVLSVDEKPNVQAIERFSGYVYTSSSTIVQGLQSVSTCHGTLNLISAIEIAARAGKSSAADKKRRIDFLEFMSQAVEDSTSGLEIHAVTDNSCINKKSDSWLTEHPNVTFHISPTSDSWLSLAALFFGIFTRKGLNGANFKSQADLVSAIKKFIEVYNDNARPFVWRKRAVNGSQPRNNMKSLQN